MYIQTLVFLDIYFLPHPATAYVFFYFYFFHSRPFPHTVTNRTAVFTLYSWRRVVRGRRRRRRPQVPSGVRRDERVPTKNVCRRRARTPRTFRTRRTRANAAIVFPFAHCLRRSDGVFFFFRRVHESKNNVTHRKRRKREPKRAYAIFYTCMLYVLRYACRAFGSDDAECRVGGRSESGKIRLIWRAALGSRLRLRDFFWSIIKKKKKLFVEIHYGRMSGVLISPRKFNDSVVSRTPFVFFTIFFFFRARSTNNEWTLNGLKIRWRKKKILTYILQVFFSKQKRNTVSNSDRSKEVLVRRHKYVYLGISFFDSITFPGRNNSVVFFSLLLYSLLFVTCFFVLL